MIRELDMQEELETVGGNWLRCAAGVVGGAILGGLGGAAVGFIRAPTVPAAPIGWGIVGAVGGGIKGAADNC
jgi:hypothetical protein